MPVTESGAYSVPVMARRDLHGDCHSYASNSYASNSSAFASPTRFISNVRSQLVNSYSAIRDRLTHQEQQHLSPVPPRLVQQLDTLVRPRTRRQRVTNVRNRPPFIRRRDSTMTTISNNNNSRRRVPRVNKEKKRRTKAKTPKKRMEIIFLFESSNESFAPHSISCRPSGTSSSRYRGGY